MVRVASSRMPEESAAAKTELRWLRMHAAQGGRRSDTYAVHVLRWPITLLSITTLLCYYHTWPELFKQH